MKYLKTFESYDSETISHNPIIRHIAGQGIDNLQQTDRLDTSKSCQHCPKYISKRSGYCGMCGSCLLSREETLAKMTLVRDDKKELKKLSRCIKKHRLENPE